MQLKRLTDRHRGTGSNVEFYSKMYALYEPAEEDEKNSFNVTVTENMAADDVVECVQRILQQL